MSIKSEDLQKIFMANSDIIRIPKSRKQLPSLVQKCWRGDCPRGDSLLCHWRLPNKEI